METQNTLSIKTYNHKSKNRLITLILFLAAIIMITSSCRHARVTLNPPLPKECVGERISQKICEAEKSAAQNKRSQSQGSTHEIKQVFYLWGFTPKKITVDTTSLCPLGVKEIHEHATWKDGLFSEVTVGIYMPRTAVITCY
jgi:hypothetical protein